MTRIIDTDYAAAAATYAEMIAAARADGYRIGIAANPVDDGTEDADDATAVEVAREDVGLLYIH